MSTDNIPSNASDLTFGTPKASTRGRKSVWSQRAKAMAELLTSKPDQWALFRDGLNASHASSIATTYRKRLPSIEFLVVRGDDARYSVWMRFPSGAAVDLQIME